MPSLRNRLTSGRRLSFQPPHDSNRREATSPAAATKAQDDRAISRAKEEPPYAMVKVLMNSSPRKGEGSERNEGEVEGGKKEGGRGRGRIRVRVTGRIFFWFRTRFSFFFPALNQQNARKENLSAPGSLVGFCGLRDKQQQRQRQRQWRLQAIQ